MIEKKTYHTQEWIDGWNAATDAFRDNNGSSNETYYRALSLLTPESLAEFLCYFECPPGHSNADCMLKTNKECVICCTEWLNKKCDWELLAKIVCGEPYDD